MYKVFSIFIFLLAFDSYGFELPDVFPYVDEGIKEVKNLDCSSRGLAKYNWHYFHSAFNPSTPGTKSPVWICAKEINQKEFDRKMVYNTVDQDVNKCSHKAKRRLEKAIKNYIGLNDSIDDGRVIRVFAHGTGSVGKCPANRLKWMRSVARMALRVGDHRREKLNTMKCSNTDLENGLSDEALLDTLATKSLSEKSFCRLGSSVSEGFKGVARKEENPNCNKKEFIEAAQEVFDKKIESDKKSVGLLLNYAKAENPCVDSQNWWFQRVAQTILMRLPGPVVMMDLDFSGQGVTVIRHNEEELEEAATGRVE